MQGCLVGVEFATPCRVKETQKAGSSINDHHWLIAIILAIVFVIVLIGFFAYSLTRQDTNNDEVAVSNFKLGKQNLSTVVFRKGATTPPRQLQAEYQTRTKPRSFAELFSPGWTAAVYSDHKSCSDIGRAILLRGGNAVDAAVASALCLSAALPQRGGLGGGLMATIYSDSLCTTLNSRETCPSQATESYFLNHRDETVVGAKAVAVPGFLSGLYRAFERFSSKHLTWRQLVAPTIELCVRGVTVSAELSADLQQFYSLVANDPLMRSQFINETTRKPLAEGGMMLCPQLANFLSDISDSKSPVDYFYRGEGTARLLKAINDEDAFITARDLDDFESEFQSAIHSNLRQSTLCGPAPPSVFSVVQLAVAAMLEANSNSSTIPGFAWDLSAHISDPLFDSDIMRDVEKMMNGRDVEEVLHRFRNGNRSEVKWQPTEEGSFSVFAIDENGNAASIVSSLGDKFGSRLFTNLGFFLNNAMGAFTYDTRPGSVRSRNAPQPAKGPRTQMSPVIGLRNGQVDFVAGSTDYPRLCNTLLSAVLRRHTEPAFCSNLLLKDENGLHLRSEAGALLSGY